jgi:hypothetical protein
LIKNVSKDNYNYLRDQLTNAFVNLNAEQHIFLVINITPITENIFGIMNNNTTTTNILKNILSGLCIGVNDEYIIKCINSCKVINKNISDSIVIEYIQNNGYEIVMNDNLLSFFLKYLSNTLISYETMVPIINIKLTSIMENLARMALTNMDFAFEIYKLGKIIINSNLQISRTYMWSHEILIFSNEQLEYIAKSVHTCIVNKNISQAQTIHAIIYYMNDSQREKYIKYYNKFLELRIKSNTPEDILRIEYELWNINNNYKDIMTRFTSTFSVFCKIVVIPAD